MSAPSPLAPLLENAGFIMDAGFAIVVLIFGKSLFAPPVRLQTVVVRLIACLCGIAAFLVWHFAPRLDTGTIESITVGSAIGAFMALLAYAAAYRSLCFHCRDDPTLYLAGLVLRKEAKLTLAGDLNQAPPYGPLETKPASDQLYFCDAGKKPEIIWRNWSNGAAEALMIVLYAALVVGAAIMLCAGAMLLARPDVEVTTTDSTTRLEMPADILFEIDKAELATGAERELGRAASILEARGVTEATIEGHTDSTGSVAHNQLLSQRRAAAVYSWLTNEGGLDASHFHIMAYGATRPRAPNVRADGSDDPDGRARNRRVEIVFSSAR